MSDQVINQPPNKNHPENLEGITMDTPLAPSEFLPRAIVKVLWDFYDGIGWWLLMNLIVFFIGSLWFLFVLALTSPWKIPQEASLFVRLLFLGIQGLLFLIPALTITMSWMMPYARGFNSFSEPEQNPFRQGLKDIKKNFLAVSLWVLSTFIIILNITFYTSQNIFPSSFKWIGLALAGIFIWLLLFVSAIAIFAFPMIAEGKWSNKEVFKRALYIVIIHKFTVLGMFFFIALIWGIGIVLRFVGLATFCLAFSVLISNSIYSILVEYYKGQEALKNIKEKQQQQAPATWKEKNQIDSQNVDLLLYGKPHPTRYSRTLRDLIKPWE